ncbi:MAG: hypothetical protein ABIY55_14255 [Kofleriaceae bacterium]
MNLLRRLATIFAVSAAMTGCVVSSDNTDATLTVHNESQYDITDLYVAPVGSRTWGPNLLHSGEVIFAGDQLTLTAACGTYDVQVIDETNVDCVVPDVDLCLNDADWIVHDNTCHVNGLVKAARDAQLKTSRDAYDAAHAVK